MIDKDPFYCLRYSSYNFLDHGLLEHHRCCLRGKAPDSIPSRSAQQSIGGKPLLSRIRIKSLTLYPNFCRRACRADQQHQALLPREMSPAELIDRQAGMVIALVRK